MLIAIFLYVQKPADGLQRFQDLMHKARSFSVQMSDHSAAFIEVGKGSLLVQKPSSFRLDVVWGSNEYTYVKSPLGSVDFIRSLRNYEEYPRSTGLVPTESALGNMQAESTPLELVEGNLSASLPQGVKYKLTSQEKGTDSYAASWNDGRSKGNVVAAIDPMGRLIHFEVTASSQTGSIHRAMEFSNYMFDPPLTAATFSLVPPLGYTAYEFPLSQPTVSIGETLTLGKWKTRQGLASIDPLVRGKLLIVRLPESAPADQLLAYLGKKKLPVSVAVASLGTSGGQFWSPTPQVAEKLSTVGTPLLILLDSQNKVKGLWLGFDSEKPGDLIDEIIAATKGKEDE